MDSPQITAQFSEASQTEGANHLIFQPEFFSHVNCKLVPGNHYFVVSII